MYTCGVDVYMEVVRKTIENDYYFLKQVSDDVD